MVRNVSIGNERRFVVVRKLTAFFDDDILQSEVDPLQGQTLMKIKSQIDKRK